MKVGDIVLFDFPGHRYEWSRDYPDDSIGLIVGEDEHECFEVMTQKNGVEEIHGHYLVALV